MFEKLEKEAARVLARDPEILTEVIVKCATIKAQVVEQDDKEAGIRCILNFGHTVGHAIEGKSSISNKPKLNLLSINGI
ncbi:hypothetical protein M1146_06885 [Patescibacteria group bacterium]|nr:hypothetical protein [Patescibacteria group bacterium]